MKVFNYLEFINESLYDTSYKYEDGFVTATLNDNDGVLQILDWNSKNTEKGGTEKSLLKFRYKYPIIHAIDTGYEHEDSFKYWKHMLSKELIDGFSDDNGEFHE